MNAKKERIRIEKIEKTIFKKNIFIEALFFYMNKNFKKAIEHWVECDVADSFYQIAWIYYKLKNYEQSLNYLKKGFSKKTLYKEFNKDRLYSKLTKNVEKKYLTQIYEKRSSIEE